MDLVFRRSDGSHVSVYTVHLYTASVFHAFFSRVVPSPERRGSPVVRTLAYHAGSIPGLGGENY